MRISGRHGLGHLKRREFILVLSAAGLPWFIARAKNRDHIYVPSLLAKIATNEIEAYKSENLPKKSSYSGWPLHNDWPFAPLYLLPLIWWHYTGTNYLKKGSLDSIAILLHGEWFRTVTALTLHNGLTHLTGNLVFGSFFLALLGRLCGVGHSWLLVCIGGICGNLASLLTHNLGYNSVGFSTALFAGVGAIAGILIWRQSERILLPIAAALAFLALLGVEGANTDYGAHICGLGSGLILGAGEGFALRKGWRLLPQWLAAFIAIAIPVCAWAYLLQ